MFQNLMHCEWPTFLMNVLPRNFNYDTVRSYCSTCILYTGGSRFSGKGVHVDKGVGFALLILSKFS